MNLTNGYNGHLTSREAGSVGGQMVKNVRPDEPQNSSVKTPSPVYIYKPFNTQQA